MSTDDRAAAADGSANTEPRAHKGKHVSLACNACKRLKVKCSGVVPCSYCTAKGISCSFDQRTDGRRDRKRTLEDLHSKADALETILKSLKSANDTSSSELVKTISGANTSEELTARLQLWQDRENDKFHLKTRRAALDIAALIDQPLVRLPAKPWTSVTDDDHAISHLISVYFTWQHPGYPSVDQDIFVKHMSSGDKSSKFCSPVLVNSMCLVACSYTDHPAAFADPKVPSTRGLHFLDEITKLWSLEQRKGSLTSLQALPNYISGVVILGKDRIGIELAHQCAHMTSDLAREVKKARKRGQRELETDEFQRSYSLARWASFLVQTEVAVAWIQPLELRKPSRYINFTDEELSRPSSWRPYPKTGPEITFFASVLASERFKLYDIASGLLTVVLSGTPNDSPLPGFSILEDHTKLERLFEICKRLSDWQRDLSPKAQVGNMDESLPAGPLIDLHLAFNGFQVSAAGLVLRTAGLTETQKVEATASILNACSNIAHLVQWQQRSLGLEYFSIYLFHSTSLSAYSLLPFLDHRGAAEIFHVMIVALSTVSSRWTIAHGAVRMIWIEVQRQNLASRLGSSTLSLLKLSAVDGWGPDDWRLFEECAYPNYAAIKERGILLAEMGELLREYSQLSVVDGDDRGGKFN